MNARFLTTAAMVSALCGMLPARAADPRLLNLVMPDAKVLAGVNVDKAKVTPFGMWVIGQMQLQGNQLKDLTAATGFDPTRDVNELLVATASVGAKTATGTPSGLAVALGNFDPARINALALSKAGALTELYNKVTIVEDPKQQAGFAFIGTDIVIAGDLASVKAAIDRHQNTGPVLAAPAMLQVNSWSTAQDAWVIMTVPPSTLHTTTMPPIPGLGPQGQNNAFQNIQSAAAGVKFGTNVVVTGQAVAGTAQDATQMGDTLKLLASLAQMQSNADPNLLALTRSLTVATSGATLTATVSMPQDTLVQILKNGAQHRSASPNVRRPGARKQ